MATACRRKETRGETVSKVGGAPSGWVPANYSTRLELEWAGFACMLGGEDGKTLFIYEADWLGREAMDAVIAKRAGMVLMVRDPAPHTGYP